MRKEAAGENRRPCHRGGVESASRASADKCRHPAVPGIARGGLRQAADCSEAGEAGCRDPWHGRAELSHILDALSRESVVPDAARTTVPPCPADTTSIHGRGRCVLPGSLSCRACMLSNPLVGPGDQASLRPPQCLDSRKMPNKRVHKDGANPKIFGPTTSRKTRITNSCMTPPPQRSWTSYDELPLRSIARQRLHPGRCPCKRCLREWSSKSPL
jgi:hypothetical protein